MALKSVEKTPGRAQGIWGQGLGENSGAGHKQAPKVGSFLGSRVGLGRPGSAWVGLGRPGSAWVGLGRPGLTVFLHNHELSKEPRKTKPRAAFGAIFESQKRKNYIWEPM